MKQKGFTLIEIIVAVAIFIIVTLIALIAVLSAVDANRKAQNFSTVVNDLNVSLDTMVRELRTGHDYVVTCAYGCISFTDEDGKLDVQYNLVTSGSEKYIEKVGPSGVNGLGRITSDNVYIEDLDFIALGTGPTDGKPEHVLLRVKGYAGDGKLRSSFNVETVITSRTLQVEELN